MNATVWKDLAGNINLPIEAGGSWESDCLYCDGVNPGVVQRLTVGNGCPYYECVFQALSQGTSGSWRIFHTRISGTTSYEKFVGYEYRSSTNWVVINKRSTVHTDTKKHFVACNTTDKYIVDEAMMDGNPVSFQANYGGGSFGYGIAIGCSLKSNTPIWQQPVECRVFALRIYDRALSPAEIAHNYAIDKARFNLP